MSRPLGSLAAPAPGDAVERQKRRDDEPQQAGVHDVMAHGTERATPVNAPPSSDLKRRHEHLHALPVQGAIQPSLRDPAGVGVHAGSLTRTALAALLLLVTGCATLPPFATKESMDVRARCLKADGLWLETQIGFQCRPRVAPERT